MSVETNTSFPVLGIETSCDDTGVAIYCPHAGLLAHGLHSQTEVHARYGGVVPELASRKHVEAIVPVVTEAIRESGSSTNQIDAIAVID